MMILKSFSNYTNGYVAPLTYLLCYKTCDQVFCGTRKEEKCHEERTLDCRLIISTSEHRHDKCSLFVIQYVKMIDIQCVQATMSESPIPGGGVLPSNGLLGMCRRMGLHLYGWTDYNGVAFSGIFNGVTKMGLKF